jgi:hypothetical protein
VENGQVLGYQGSGLSKQKCYTIVGKNCRIHAFL